MLSLIVRHSHFIHSLHNFDRLTLQFLLLYNFHPIELETIVKIIILPVTLRLKLCILNIPYEIITRQKRINLV